MSDIFIWFISVDNQFDNMIKGKQGFSEVESTI